MAYDRILVPVDGSAPSSAGLAQALRLCAPGTQVKLLHVLENPTYAYGAMDYALDYDELFAAQEVQGWKTLESAAAAAKALLTPGTTTYGTSAAISAAICSCIAP